MADKKHDDFQLEDFHDQAWTPFKLIILMFVTLGFALSVIYAAAYFSHH